ncbi:MAG: Na+/H+ antiporter subunit E [Limnochordales bacterium]
MWHQLPIHIGLALAWMAMWGDFSGFHFVAGLIIGGAILYALTKGTHQPFYLKRVVALIRFVLVFLWVVVVSGAFVVRISLAPRLQHRPGIIALPLRLETDAAITALTHMLTLTPGAVPIDISADRSEIFIHCLDLNDMESVRASKERFEDLLLEVTQ